MPEPPLGPGELSARAPAPTAVLLCASDALVERGHALVFDVLEYCRPARAFALRFDGQVRAYLNRCAHVPTELDWLPGEFLDAARERIVCSLHGAQYEPASGRCLGGPCGRGGLTPLAVTEQDGEVRWYPCRDIRPSATAQAPPAHGGHGESNP